VVLSFAFSWLLVDLIGRRLRPEAFALAGPLVLTAVVAATTLSVNVFSVRPRLRSHSSDFLAGIAAPTTFEQNNELHRIWFSIIKSAIHDKSFIVGIDRSLVPAD
jgi:hypothetical protein